MRVAILLATVASICITTANAHTCANVPAHVRDNDKKYEAKKLAGDKAFREGKYDRAAAEYREALAYQDEAGAYDISSSWARRRPCRVNSKRPTPALSSQAQAKRRRTESSPKALRIPAQSKPRKSCWTPSRRTRRATRMVRIPNIWRSPQSTVTPASRPKPNPRKKKAASIAKLQTLGNPH
jgi:hypothetical protein